MFALVRRFGFISNFVYFLLGNSPAPENYPEESIQHSEHGESLKSRIIGNCNEISIK